jgi:lipopolysaccharide/colanic/teichoic acid biosynthesis glycosyltransferase
MNSLTAPQAFIKRVLDLFVAVVGLSLTWWLIALSWVLASIDTGANGFFTQLRVGRDGRLFKVIKMRTMRVDRSVNTTVTTRHDPRITRLGGLLRRSKIDELPQLINVLFGQMSLVGPRPDVPGFADRLEGDDRLVLAVRPGITGPATLKYRNEEELLASVSDPEAYNRDVIFPDKVRINREYVENWSFAKDLGYLLKTVLG